MKDVVEEAKDAAERMSSGTLISEEEDGEESEVQTQDSPISQFTDLQPGEPGEAQDLGGRGTVAQPSASSAAAPAHEVDEAGKGPLPVEGGPLLVQANEGPEPVESGPLLVQRQGAASSSSTNGVVWVRDPEFEGFIWEETCGRRAESRQVQRH